MTSPPYSLSQHSDTHVAKILWEERGGTCNVFVGALFLCVSGRGREGEGGGGERGRRETKKSGHTASDSATLAGMSMLIV